jgi:hypothetical protein
MGALEVSHLHKSIIIQPQDDQIVVLNSITCNGNSFLMSEQLYHIQKQSKKENRYKKIHKFIKLSIKRNLKNEESIAVAGIERQDFNHQREVMAQCL